MARFNSYKAILERYLLDLQPERILEWGPGGSTSLMVSLSDADIHTFEHNYRWYEEAVRNFIDVQDRVHIYYRPDLEKYIHEPESMGKFDLVFVDGLCETRVRCLLVAANLLNEGAVVILHDSERTIYDEGRRPYVLVDELDGTAVMKKR